MTNDRIKLVGKADEKTKAKVHVVYYNSVSIPMDMGFVEARRRLKISDMIKVMPAPKNFPPNTAWLGVPEWHNGKIELNNGVWLVNVGKGGNDGNA